jgi:hypothetical protein
MSNSAQEITPGKSYVFVVALPNSLSSVDSIGFKWSKEVDIFQPKTWNLNLNLNFLNDNNKNNTETQFLFIKQIIVKPLSLKSKEIVFCNNSGLGIEPQKMFTFSTKC